MRKWFGLLVLASLIVALLPGLTLAQNGAGTPQLGTSTSDTVTAPPGTATAGVTVPRFTAPTQLPPRGGTQQYNVLLVNADDDNSLGSPIQQALLAFGDLGAVDLFNAMTGTPTLDQLLAYDVVVTWSNYQYADPVAIGNVLADYVDQGGWVINLMFALGTSGWQMQGRFMDQGYTALNGGSNLYLNSCLGTYDPANPIMQGITDVCDLYRLSGTYLTPGSTEVARWQDGELFIAQNSAHTVVTMAAYVGYYHQWTGQMPEVVHNAILYGFVPFVGISLTPLSQTGQGCQGDTIAYNMQLCNSSGAAGTFDLDYQSIFPISGPPSLDVDEGACVPFVVSVTIPCDGVSDTATITASGNGFTASATITTNAQVGGGWAQIASEPDNGRMDNVLSAYGGFVWSITGYGANTNVRKYDPGTNTWTTVGTMPPFGVNYARSGCTAGSKVYLYGDAAGTMTGLWEYDMATGVWTQKTPGGTPPPYNAIWAPAWVADPETGLCYMTGGATTPGTGNLTTTFVYDPATNAWLAALPNFQTVRDFHAAWIFTHAVSGKLLCVAGGNNNNFGLTSTQCYHFNSGTWAGENADVAALTGDRWGMGYAVNFSATDEELLWMTGGVLVGAITANTAYYDTAAGIWVDGGNLPAGAVYRTAATMLDNEVYGIGGSISSFTYVGYANRLVQCPECTLNKLHINKDKMKFAPTPRPGINRIVFKARIYDQANVAAPDANVLGTWTFPDGGTLDVSAMTNIMGLVKFVQKSSMTGTYGFCITDLVKAGYAYDPGANTAPECLSVVVP